MQMSVPVQPLPDQPLKVQPGLGVSVKVAVTRLADATETVQVPVPLHPLPDQPANVEPVLALAVSVTLER
jgi:hypothetical protein